MADQLHDIVGRMIAAGESEENIAAVIKQMSAVQQPVASHRPEPTNEIERMTRDLEAKGGLSPRMASFLVDGLSSGGFSTAAPIVKGAVQEGMPIIQGLGRRLYNGLLKPSKAVRQEFGDVVPGLLDKRRLITARGAEAAEDAVTASAKKADDMIAQSPRPSQGVGARRIVQEFRPVREAVRARVDAGVAPASELDKVVERARRMRQTANASGGRIDPSRAQTLKRTAQDAAEGGYRQMERGNAKMLSTDDLLDAATARGFKGGIEDIVPGIAQQNQATQTLIGEARAMSDAVGRTSNHLPFGSVSDLAAMTAGATNPMLGVAGKLSTMAGPGSAMAIGLNELGKPGLANAWQRALLAVMQQNMHGSEQ